MEFADLAWLFTPEAPTRFPTRGGPKVYCSADFQCGDSSLSAMAGGESKTSRLTFLGPTEKCEHRSAIVRAPYAKSVLRRQF